MRRDRRNSLVANATFRLHNMKSLSMKPRELKRVAEAHGWRHVRTSGGHWIMTKEGKRSVPISSHAREFPPSFVKVLLKQLGLHGKGIR